MFKAMDPILNNLLYKANEKHKIYNKKSFGKPLKVPDE